jgi:cobalt-zinc-cadmium efflux system membrane fusion protein
MRNSTFVIIGVAVLAAALAAVGPRRIQEKIRDYAAKTAPEEYDEAGPAEFERGPHRGRLLRDGGFALEITIFEDGVPPQFRLYAYENGKPVAPGEIEAAIALTRIDGEENVFRFVPKDDFLDGDGVVEEPHSFDVKASATHKGKPHRWSFSSYEGRTAIAPEAAEAAGIKIETAGPALIREKIALTGRIALDPGRSAQIRARFPGVVREMRKNLGDAVQAGDTLATVESNDSLQVYSIKAPIGGVVLARNANVGSVTDDAPLYHIADLSVVWAEFRVFPRDLKRIKPGLRVHVADMEGETEADAVIAATSPTAQAASQTVQARAVLDNAEGRWRPGMAVRGEATASERMAPLAVKTAGLQRFRDFTVVFAKAGDRYEVRMLELGVNDGETAEVLGGIKPGTPYVSENSFIVKADIEKSGASHDH